jgi:C4-dicarboxylate-specific signal transduction histidine kinase
MVDCPTKPGIAAHGTSDMRSRTVLGTLIVAAVLAATAAAWLITREAELRGLRERADKGLSLDASSVASESERYGHLPFVVAQDERILQLLDTGGDALWVDRANRYLETVAQQVRVQATPGGKVMPHDLFVMDATGTTLASSNWQDPDSRLGKNYKFRPYFQDAMKTGEGAYYAIGATGGIPGYYLAHRIDTAAGHTGVAVVKVFLEPLEVVWRAAGENVGLVDHAGVIFLSDVKGWKWCPLFPLDLDPKGLDALKRQYSPDIPQCPPLQLDRNVKPGQDIDLQIAGRQMLARLLEVPGRDWQIMAAHDMAPVYAAANRSAATAFLAGALLIAAWFYFRERRERINADRMRAILEDMTVGIAVFDPDLRLVAWNQPYIRLNSYPAALVRAGRPLAEIIQHNAQRGDYGPGDPTKQTQIRLERVQQTVRRVEVRRPDGTWLDMAHSRTPGGWIVRTYSDITERKHTEEELAAHRNNLERIVEQRTAELVQLNQRLRVAVDQLEQREQSLAEKSTALEVLSGKLAKYLAPQVYNSIFTGQQDVRIASHRKKLTVCFSDIAGFTETTDKMESEDLTQLLNHYLTEMSHIASAHGATIDKYVGDAIVMFFGDPDSRGVKEDALACVTMALAMQKRMGELALVWRDAGIETPFRCKIGINTDYCTVGNFGSEDRMDYTIIGSAVNLASRLEREAQPGAVLISYETFAQVKDEIHCEEHGHIKVKGIAYPVATFRVVDLKNNLVTKAQAVTAELPHLRVQAEPGLMSAKERDEAVKALRDLLDRLC